MVDLVPLLDVPRLERLDRVQIGELCGSPRDFTKGCKRLSERGHAQLGPDGCAAGRVLPLQ